LIISLLDVESQNYVTMTSRYCAKCLRHVVTLKKSLVQDSEPYFYIAELQPIFCSKTATSVTVGTGVSLEKKIQWHRQIVQSL